MLNTGKCPKCGTRLTNVTIEQIDLKEGFSTVWTGASYVCPSCSTILAVEVDPTALRNAIVADLKKVLRG
ncbi:hypothetical protein GCM10011321_14800 [Youhaiella tibetensis]|nr:hypothetical protein GCM10011321_14800 [Youhaiella tibetensis]